MTDDVDECVAVVIEGGNSRACGLPVVSKVKRLCQGHLKRLSRSPFGVLQPGPPIRSQGARCSVTDCDERVHSKGLCATHFFRMQRSGTTDRMRMQNKGNTCQGYNKVCTNPATRRGFCNSCYWKAYNDTKKVLKELAHEDQ